MTTAFRATWFHARRLGAAALLAAPLVGCDRTEATAPAGALSAHRSEGTSGLPTRYVLPGPAVFPEGIAYDERTGTVYVTSAADGSVFRGDVRDSVLAPFLPGGADGRVTALGIAVDPRRQRLFVAGGQTGRVFVYDARSRALLATLAGGSTPTFVNDVAVTPDGAAYFTDSQSPVIYRVVEDRAAGFRLERWLDLTNTVIRYGAQFNLNGIEATPDGRFLFTVQSNTGQLFQIDTRTRAVAAVDLGGERLTGGDGLLLQGATLYAVQNQLGVIAEVRLQGFGPGAPRQTAPRGRVIRRIADPTLRFPTTLEGVRGRLLVVNAQFDRLGPGLAPDLPFTLSVVRP